MMTALGTLELRALDQFPPEAVDELLARYEFYPYRHWRGFGLEVPKRLLRWDLLNGETTELALRLLAMEGLRPVGLACIIPSRWESEQLDTKLAEIRHLITVGNGEQRRCITGALVEFMRQQLSGTVDCLVHRVDSADAVTVAMLEAYRFHLVDTTVSFVSGPGIVPFIRRTFPRPCAVRLCREEDWPEVEVIVRERGFAGRFYNDPRLDRARCDVLYREWARLAVQGVFADEVVVALRHGRVAGFLSYQWQPGAYEVAKIRLRGRGLLAVGSAYKGLALELIRGAILWDEKAEFRQFDTQLNNHEFWTLLNRGLRMDVAHVRHVFHGWLNAPPAQEQGRF